MDSLLDRIRAALAPHYQVHRWLGQGGMGVVVQATEVALRREVAIKLLRPELASARAAERFTREAQHLARVRHGNVVMIHQVGEQGGLFFAVMELVNGETLEQRLARGPLPVREARRIGEQLLDGLAAVHAAGLIHRDIKPGNIFLRGEDALLADFGIARSIAETSGSTTADSAGTPEYMAPEQWLNGPLTPRTDLHAVGAVLYEAITGSRWSVIPGREEWRRVPRTLRPALMKALDPDPARRWQDAAQFRRALASPLPRLPDLRLAGAALLLLAAALVTAIILRRPPRLLPPVAFTMRPFLGGAEGAAPDTIAARRIALYIGNQLETFRGWVPARPVSKSLLEKPPRRARLPEYWNSRFLVSGEILPGGALRVEVRAGDTEALVDQFEVPGPFDPLPQSKVAAAELIRRHFPEHRGRYEQLMGQGGSQSPRAVDAFIAGKDAFHRGSYDSAQARFRRALEYDPEFSLAAWQLALTNRWRRTLRTEELQALATRHIPRLPTPYRELLAAQLEPGLEQRLARLRAIVTAHPGNGDAHLHYADELFHRGPVIGIPLDSAVAAFHRAVEMDPYLDAAPPLDHAVWAAILLGRRRDAHAALVRRGEIAARPGEAALNEGPLRVRFLEFAYDERFVPWRGRLKRLYFRWPGEKRLDGISRYIRLGLSFDIPATEVMLGEVLARRGKPDALRAQGYMAQGLGLMALGRPGQGFIRFDSAAALFQTAEAQLQRAQWRLLPAALGLPHASPSQVSLGRLILHGLHGTPGIGARADATLLLADTGAAPDTQGAALLRAAAPDDSTARQTLALLEARHLARTIGPAAALRRSDSLVQEGRLVGTRAPFVRALLYLSRAEWQEALGDREAALRSLLWWQNTDIDGWAQGEAQAGDVDGVLGVLARLRSGALLLDLGRRAEGCPLVARVRQLWAGAEESYAGLRARADSLHARCRA